MTMACTGIDLAKQVFQIYDVDRAGINSYRQELIFERTLSDDRFMLRCSHQKIKYNCVNTCWPNYSEKCPAGHCLCYNSVLIIFSILINRGVHANEIHANQKRNPYN